MPASASVMSMSVLSMLSTRSDSSTQSARALARRRPGSALGLQGHLGRAAQAGQRRAQVVRDVVERLAHGADQRLVLVEQGVEQPDQFVEFVVGVADRHAGVQLAGADDGAGGGHDLAHRAAWRGGRRRRPARKPRSTVTLPTIRKLRRTGSSSASRLLVVRPTCSSEPSGRADRGESEIPFRVLAGCG